MRGPFRRLAPIVPLALLVRPVIVLGQSAEGFAARGDSLMAARETRAAVETYRDGLAAHPDSPLLGWKTARSLSNLAEETSGPEDDERLYGEAVRLARDAVGHAPRSARAHATLAAALGRLAQFRGGRGKVELAREVHEHALRATGLDPNDFAGYVVLGVWNREVATLNFFLRTFAANLLGGLPDASLERSAALLERSVRLAPDYVTPNLELARTYVEMDRERDARDALTRAIDAPVREALDTVRKEEARLLQRELDGR